MELFRFEKYSLADLALVKSLGVEKAKEAGVDVEKLEELVKSHNLMEDVSGSSERASKESVVAGNKKANGGDEEKQNEDVK